MLETILIFTMMNLALSGVLFFYVLKWKKSQALHVSYIADRVEDLQGKINVLSKVLKIFEDETQILQKRNEQQALKQRFRQQR